MQMIILHSALVEASRALMEELGGEPSAADVTLARDGAEVRVVSKHALAVGLCPAFTAYPAVAVTSEGGAVRVKSPVSSWAQCLAFAGEEPEPEAQRPPSGLTRLEFLDRFTDEEKLALKNLEDTDVFVALFWEQFRAAQSIDLGDQRTVQAVEYLGAQGHISPERAAEILGR